MSPTRHQRSTPALAFKKVWIREIFQDFQEDLNKVKADVKWLKWAIGLLYPVLLAVILEHGGRG